MTKLTGTVVPAFCTERGGRWLRGSGDWLGTFGVTCPRGALTIRLTCALCSGGSCHTDTEVPWFVVTCSETHGFGYGGMFAFGRMAWTQLGRFRHNWSFNAPGHIQLRVQEEKRQTQKQEAVEPTGQPAGRSPAPVLLGPLVGRWAELASDG